MVHHFTFRFENPTIEDVVVQQLLERRRAAWRFVAFVINVFMIWLTPGFNDSQQPVCSTTAITATRFAGFDAYAGWG